MFEITSFLLHFCTNHVHSHFTWILITYMRISNTNVIELNYIAWTWLFRHCTKRFDWHKVRRHLRGQLVHCLTGIVTSHMSGVHLQAINSSLLDDHHSIPGRAIYFLFHHSCSLVQGLSKLSPSVAFLFSSQKIPSAVDWSMLVSI